MTSKKPPTPAPDLASLAPGSLDADGMRRVRAARTRSVASRQLDDLLEISRALASQRDSRSLLSLILSKSREITGADAGSVYVVEDTPDSAPLVASASGAGGLGSAAGPAAGEAAGDKAAYADPRHTGRARLRFMLAQNDSMPVALEESFVPVDATSVVGRAVLDNQLINIPDLYRLHEPGRNPWGVQHNRKFDEQLGYQARSMLTVPLTSVRGTVIGVIQLINRKPDGELQLETPADFETRVLPFDAESEGLALALAAQAGICLENAVLYEEIQAVFEGFVDASVKAIESRDPSTSGHSRRVATLSVALAETVDGLSSGRFAAVKFGREDLRQIEYAGVLHDFGKVGVREDVLVKAKKLYGSQKAAIRLRFDFAQKSLEAEALGGRLAAAEGKLSPAARAQLMNRCATRSAEIDELWQLVLAANEPSVTGERTRARLADLGRQTYTDASGVVRPLLLPDEIDALQVVRGSLTGAEREEIQSHVQHTLAFLRTIPWGRSLRRIPSIAGGHHEALDGSGYPLGLSGEQIAIETRILTIADIFDALTASDRPYKSAVPVPRALDILAAEVKRGRCDSDLFDVFVKARLFERVL